jgi:hypothetical protein
MSKLVNDFDFKDVVLIAKSFANNSALNGISIERMAKDMFGRTEDSEFDERLIPFAEQVYVSDVDHSGGACFVLTPLDTLRLKNNLNVSAPERIVKRDHNGKYYVLYFYRYLPLVKIENTDVGFVSGNAFVNGKPFTTAGTYGIYFPFGDVDNVVFSSNMTMGYDVHIQQDIPGTPTNLSCGSSVMRSHTFMANPNDLATYIKVRNSGTGTSLNVRPLDFIQVVSAITYSTNNITLGNFGSSFAAPATTQIDLISNINRSVYGTNAYKELYETIVNHQILKPKNKKIIKRLDKHITTVDDRVVNLGLKSLTYAL